MSSRFSPAARSAPVVAVLAALALANGCASHQQKRRAGNELPSGSPARFTSGAEQQSLEAFLRTADVTDRETVPQGVTRPQRLTLSDGTTTRRALWKTLDENVPIQEFRRGRPELRFKDSYRHEIAAYELDKLLGLRMVPPTVERHLGRQTGCLQLWLEGCITEADRLTRGLHAPDAERWNRQMYEVRLFHQLIDDPDARNVSNLLVDADFNLYVIDSSRAFRYHHELGDAGSLRRFSRRLLERLEALTPQLLEDRLGRWLTGEQTDALLARRDLILALAARRVEDEGPRVLYP